MWKKIFLKRLLTRLMSLGIIVFLVWLSFFRPTCDDDFYCHVKNDWEVPSDATDIHVEGESSREYYDVTLDFKATAAGLPNFIRHICDGILHPGYDPYNALNVGHSLSGQHLYLIKYAAHG